MMKEVTEELIAKYLSGNTTEEEEALVLDYMGENEEHLDDLLTSVDALREQRKSEMAARRRPVAIYSAAASVAILLVAGGIWLLKGGSANEAGEQTAWLYPQMASSQQTEQYGNPDEREFECCIIQERPAPDGVKNRPAIRGKAPVEKRQDAMVDIWEGVKSFSSDEELFADERSAKQPMYMAASIQSETKAATKNSSVSFRCNIPDKWPEGDSLRISWETNAPGVKIEIISANDYVYTDTVDDGRNSVVYSTGMRERFHADGIYIVCYVTVLPAVEGAPQMTNIIHLVEKK